MSPSRSRRRRSSGRRSPNNANNANNANNESDHNESADNDDDRSWRTNRFTTETKKATKTTEFIAYVVAVVGVVMTALEVDDDPDFGAEQAWLYITILTLGYLISRGLAKAGSHEPYDVYDE